MPKDSETYYRIQLALSYLLCLNLVFRIDPNCSCERAAVGVFLFLGISNEKIFLDHFLIQQNLSMMCSKMKHQNVKNDQSKNGKIKKLKRVWGTARDYAQQNNLRVPTLEEVRLCELSACGHVDYGSKWACGVAELLK